MSLLVRPMFKTNLHALLQLFSIADICVSYKTLDSADRNVSTPSQGLSDSSLDTKWYRFSVASVLTYMPESCPQPQTDICGATYPGWLNGIHPTTAEGMATRTVCFSDSSQCCSWSTTIQVKNCGAFYVYKLGPPPTSNLAYCATTVGE